MYRLSPRVAAETFENECIIVNLENGLYYSVQGNATELVNNLPLDNPNELIDKIASSVERVHQDKSMKELNSIWQELLKEEIVVMDTLKTQTEKDFIAPTQYSPSSLNQYADMQDLLLLDPIHDVDEDGWQVQSSVQ